MELFEKELPRLQGEIALRKRPRKIFYISKKVKSIMERFLFSLQSKRAMNSLLYMPNRPTLEILIKMQSGTY